MAAFATRDWAEIERRKRRWIAEQQASLTPAEALAMGDALRNHALAVHPDWPTPEMRRADLEAHVRLCEMLRRVQPPRSR